MSAPATTVREHGILMSAAMVRTTLDSRKCMTRRVVTPTNSVFGSAPRAFWPHADFARAFVDGKGTGSEYLHVPAHDSPDCDACREWGWAGTSHRLYPRLAPARCWDQERKSDYVPPASRLNVLETWAVGKCADGFKPTELHPGTWLKDNGGLWYAADNAEPSHPISPRGKWRPGRFMPRCAGYSRWPSRITLEVTNVRVELVQAISEEDAQAEGVDPDNSDMRRWGPYRSAFAFLWQTLNGPRGYGWDKNPWVWVIEFRRVDRS